jgi:hypothetical protein
MIIIAFVPGTFGSTIEYVLRKFSLGEYRTEIPLMSAMSDGSMHNYFKENHIIIADELEKNILKNTNKILTPIYPFRQLHTLETFEILNRKHSVDVKLIVVYVENFEMAEINILFQYHKVAIGLGLGLDIFFNTEYTKKNMLAWGTDLYDWEKREWFSLYYPKLIQTEWVDAVNYISDDSLAVSSTDLLNNTEATFDKIFAFCDSVKNDKENFKKFIVDWRTKQQYVLDEYDKINLFVEHSVKRTDYYLEHSSIIAEAIIQQKLRAKGYEIRCWNLNVFPTQASELHKLLEKV